jgi:hypothetical protein
MCAQIQKNGDHRFARQERRTPPPTRLTRGEQVAMKTSPAKREQLQRLALRMNVTFVEAFEAALDALEEKLDQAGARWRAR